TPEDLGDRPLYRGQGCPECLHTGYQGRIGIFELMVMTDDLKNFILTTSDSNQIRQRALSSSTEGVLTLRQDGLQKILAGQTTLEEVFRVT
ncbi:MAG: type II secretion system protein GspE, partial [Desulfobulbaceae bacterium]|nr:type II secretion system protein GspE [Desulfobulbaceae bacterium]